MLPVLFQIDVGDIDRGASLSFMSQYPNEDEILIPPLSYLEVVGEPFFTDTAKGEVKVLCCIAALCFATYLSVWAPAGSRLFFCDVVFFWECATRRSTPRASTAT